MKKLLKISAFLLAVLMIVPMFAGCHEKDEIAYTIDGHEYTSAMYSCVLYVAASTARNDINTFIVDQGKEEDTKESPNYEKYKFDENGKVSATGTVSYATHVKNEAIKILRQYSVLQNKMKEENLKLDEDAVYSAEIDASYYWYVGCSYSEYQYYTAYGADVSQYFTPYANNFEPNGVSLKTYTDYMVLEHTYNFYFKHLYGEDGAKEVAKETLTEYMNKHYALGDVISLTTADDEGKDLSAEDKAAVKANADAYAERLNKGEAFDVVYKAHQDSLKTEEEKKEEEDKKEEEAEKDETDKEDDKEKEYEPESYKTVFGDSETSYENDLFKDVSALKIGEVKVLEDTEQKCYIVVARRDMTEQEYWLDSFRDTILFKLKQDEFDGDLNTAGKDLSLTEDKHATKPFKVKDIKF